MIQTPRVEKPAGFLSFLQGSKYVVPLLRKVGQPSTKPSIFDQLATTSRQPCLQWNFIANKNTRLFLDGRLLKVTHGLRHHFWVQASARMLARNSALTIGRCPPENMKPESLDTGPTPRFQVRSSHLQGDRGVNFSGGSCGGHQIFGGSDVQ